MEAAYWKLALTGVGKVTGKLPASYRQVTEALTGEGFLSGSTLIVSI